MEVSAPIEIRLLGRFAVRQGGQELPPTAFGGRLVRTLIRILVSRRGRFVSKDSLVEALWPERTPADPTRNLEILVVRARRALGEPSLIVTGPGGYSFALDDRSRVDAEVVTASVESGRSHLAGGRTAAALRSFREAVAQWTGDPLPEDVYSEWAQEFRTELGRAYLEALEGGARAALAAGDTASAAALAERAIDREPLREAAHLLFVHALAASGDAAGALSRFETFRERLADELGIEPSAEAAKLQLRILRGEPLDLPESSPAPPPTPIAVAPPDHLAFVGRERELEAILGAVADPAHGMASVILVSGIAGAGKSRLLSEVAMRSPLRVLSARAFLAERETAWSLAKTLLREALALDADMAMALPGHAAEAMVDVLPELADVRHVPSLPLGAETRRALAIEGALTLLEAAAAGGAVLLADDVQWADPTSLHLLQIARERIDGAVLVLAYRPEEVPRSGPVSSALAGLRRRGARDIEVGALPPEAIAELIVDEEVAAIVAAETDRTPLAVSEVVRAMAREGALEPLPAGRWRPRSARAAVLAGDAARAGQEQAIRLRVGHLPRAQREMLCLLAVAGRETPARILAAALGIGQTRTLELLDALLRVGLARMAEFGWAAAHDLVAETLAAGLRPSMATRLHLRLAEALRADGEEPALIAPHLAAAGDSTGGARAYGEAARRAVDRFEGDEAERLADDGLALKPPPTLRGAILQSRAEARARLGNIAGAAGDLQEALTALPRGPDRSKVLSRLAILQAGAEDYGRGAELAELALAEAGEDLGARAAAMSVRARIDLNLGDLPACRARADEAMTLFRRLGDAEGRARVLDTLAVAGLEEGRIEEAIDLFDRVAMLFTTVGDLFRAVMPRATRGYALTLAARYEEALADVDKALGLARMLGYPEGEAYCLFQRCMPLAALARDREAEDSAERALTLAERVGHREWTAAAVFFLGRLSIRRDPNRAEELLRRSLDLAGSMPIWTAYAASDLARVLIAQGKLADADAMVVRALQAGGRNRKGLYVASLAQAELAAARNDPEATSFARRALAAARAGGHLISVPRLEELASSP